MNTLKTGYTLIILDRDICYQDTVKSFGPWCQHDALCDTAAVLATMSNRRYRAAQMEGLRIRKCRVKERGERMRFMP